jgi:hypothetical protein
MMRTRYWSNSKFADWIRGSGKPLAETSEGWAQWQIDAERKHPVRYWISEEGLDKLQGIIHFIPDQIYSVKYALANRFVTRTHTLTSNLPRYKWHEMDTRILHCLFDELVNFVEVELAVANFRFDEEARAKHKVPFWGTGWFRTRTYRNREAGLDYLKWAINLRRDENWGLQPGDEGYGEITDQAKSAAEVLELYMWWTDVFSKRVDPYIASGWSVLCARHRDDNKWSLFSKNQTPEQEKETQDCLEFLRKIEQDYQDEEEQMLLRLIKVRKYLWT